VHPDTVVHLGGGHLTAGRVRGDDQGFVTSQAEMLDHPKHRVGDAVDIREEGFCDDCNAHAKIIPSATVAEVACRDTTRKKLVRLFARSDVCRSSMVRTKEGR
jgi:hypothetical protein